MDLITLYGKMGLSYIEMSESEIEEELLYNMVLVPQSVYRELIENPVYADEAEIIRNTDFLLAVEVENIKSVNVLRAVTGLDEGESAALIMYDE